MKIVHISDLHLNTFFKNSNLKNIKYLLKRALEMKFDHLAITGDLTDNADPKDFEILRNLFKSNGLLESNRLSLVIGNHDIFGGIQAPEDIFNFPDKCSSINYRKKVIEFGNYFNETFNESVLRFKEDFFPFVKVIDGILILGINSIAQYSRMKNPFASNGKISKSILENVDRLLKAYSLNCKYKIILIHHHFNKIKLDSKSSTYSVWQNFEKQTMKLKKKKRILNVFKQNSVNLVLHGHWHQNLEYNRYGIRFFNGGASIKGNMPDEMKLNVIKIEEDKVTTETHRITANSSSEIHKNVRVINPEVNKEMISIKNAVNY
jgi:3',5'-cyclic AMP phosphodiesterase CpdA